MKSHLNTARYAKQSPVKGSSCADGVGKVLSSVSEPRFRGKYFRVYISMDRSSDRPFQPFIVESKTAYYV